MTSFPFALKNVFGSRQGIEFGALAAPPKTWPIFKLVPLTRLERPADPPDAELAGVVEREIIPRLVSAHPSADARLDLVPWAAPQERDPVEAFVAVLIASSAEAVERFVERREAAGVHDLFHDLLAPAARRLADLWDEDEISFTEVTIGLGRLQHLARGLERETLYNGDNDPDARSALFSPRPGEQQTFGFYMIEELFRWSGWRTWIETTASDADIVANVRCRWYDMFCLSVSRAAAIEDVVNTIGAVRRASRNPDLFVLVSGRPFDETPALVATVGADRAAASARDALEAADAALRQPVPARSSSAYPLTA